jgi:hypothetical protein
MYKIKLNQIREILGIEVSLEKIILVDGTELFTEKIEVGYPVYDAENKPVAMGEYKLFDGSTIMTDEMGVITEIVMSEVAKEAETETPEAPVEVSIEASSEAPAVDPMQLVYESISELGTEIATLKERVNSFSKAPAVAPIKKTDNEVIETTFSRLEKLKSIKNQLKK